MSVYRDAEAGFTPAEVAQQLNNKSRYERLARILLDSAEQDRRLSLRDFALVGATLHEDADSLGINAAARIAQEVARGDKGVEDRVFGGQLSSFFDLNPEPTSVHERVPQAVS